MSLIRACLVGLALAGPALAAGDREEEVTECVAAGGLWIGASSTKHPDYIPAGRCVVIITVPEMPDDREGMCSAMGGFWLPDTGEGIAACAYRKVEKE